MAFSKGINNKLGDSELTMGIVWNVKCKKYFLIENECILSVSCLFAEATIPTDQEQATGLEKEEIDALMAGNEVNLFYYVARASISVDRLCHSKAVYSFSVFSYSFV